MAAVNTEHGLLLATIAVVIAAGMLWYARRSELGKVRDEARDEALQLAAVRKEVIDAQNKRIDSLEAEVGALKLSIDQIRQDAVDAQRTITASVRLSLRTVYGYLEQNPPDVESARQDLRAMLNGGYADRRSSPRGDG